MFLDSFNITVKEKGNLMVIGSDYILIELNLHLGFTVLSFVYFYFIHKLLYVR
jgi:hypothetical protein